MKKILLIVFLLCITQFSYANQEVYNSCSAFSHGGFAKVSDSSATPLCNIAYFVLHNNSCKVPYYSLERLLPQNMDGREPRINDFREDIRLLEQHRAKNSDYLRTGFDRGHMAPNADFATDSAAALQSFYLSNMVPQVPVHNRKYWKMLETRVRKYVKANGEMIVLSGPVFTDPNGAEIIGNNVCVPTHLFKIILNPSTNEYVAVITQNADLKGKNIGIDNKIDIKELEKLTGIIFFPEIEVSNTLKFF